MTIERMNELSIILKIIMWDKSELDFHTYLRDYYDVDLLWGRFISLLDEFLSDYALTNTEKSEDTISS